MIIKSKPESNFTVIRNNLAQNTSLSFAARGLITYLLSLPPDWKVNVQHLITQTAESRKPSGRDAVYGLLKELQAHGYVEKVSSRDVSGKMTGTDWIVRDQPYTDLPDTDLPDTANPPLQKKQTSINKTANKPIAADCDENPKAQDRESPEQEPLQKTQTPEPEQKPEQQLELPLEITKWLDNYPKKPEDQHKLLRVWQSLKPDLQHLSKLTENYLHQEGNQVDFPRYVKRPESYLHDIYRHQVIKSVVCKPQKPKQPVSKEQSILNQLSKLSALELMEIDNPAFGIPRCLSKYLKTNLQTGESPAGLLVRKNKESINGTAAA